MLRKHGPTQACPCVRSFLSDEESAAALDRYERAHPQAFKQLRATIEHATGAPVENLPMVELQLR